MAEQINGWIGSRGNYRSNFYFTKNHEFITIYGTKGDGYTVRIADNSFRSIRDKNFKSKSDALAYAKSYMRRN